MKYAIKEILNTSVPLVSLIDELDNDDYVQLIYEALLSGKIKTADINKINEFIIKRFNYPFNTLRFLDEDVLRNTISSLLRSEFDAEEYNNLFNKLTASITYICLFIGEFCSKSYVSDLCKSLENIIRLYLEKYCVVDFYSFMLWYMFMGYIREDKDNRRTFIKRYLLNEAGDVFDIKDGQELLYLKKLNTLSDKGIITYIKKNLESVFTVNIEEHDFGNVNILSYEEIKELVAKTKAPVDDDELFEESFFASMDLDESVIFLIMYLLDYLYIPDFYEHNEENYVSLLLDYFYDAVSYYVKNSDEFLSDNSDFYSFVGWYAVSKLLRGI